MKPGLWFVVTISFVCLLGCRSSAPPAPTGINKRPANSPDAVSSQFLSRAHTPLPMVAAPVPAKEAEPPQGYAAPLILSDYSAPDGVKSLSAEERHRLVETALRSRAVILLCRTDRVRPDAASWRASLYRGVQVKRFLVAHGVKAEGIRIFVRSTGGFIANNGSAKGRAKNRRVEIHMT